MEKIIALINKLQELKDDPASLGELSYYTQLLYAEILHARNLNQKQEIASRTNVSVILPVTSSSEAQGGTMPVREPQEPVRRQPVPAAEKLVPAGGTLVPVGEKPVPVAINPVAAVEKPAPVVEKPLPVNERPVPPGNVHIPASAVKASSPFGIPVRKPSSSPPPPASREDPPGRELNDSITTEQPSLNDRLRQPETGLSEKLGGSPVGDLHTAIGINDKFRFIQELFDGDQLRYEHFVAAVNSSRGLGEAEQYMERELKGKHGLKEDSDVFGDFYALVKKRFSAI